MRLPGRRHAAFALALAALPLAGRAGAASSGPGTTAAPVLLVPVGARAMGMGGAFTAVATDVSAMQYNPAGLSRLNAHETAFTYVGGAGESDLQHLGYGGPTPLSGVSGNGYTSAGASLLLSQSGKIEINRLNSNGSLASSESVSAGSDLALAAAYSERAGMTSFELRDMSLHLDHYVGAGGKYLRSTLVDSYHAQTMTGDLGYLLHAPDIGWSAGVSGLNLGGKLKFRELADPLPTTVRAGAAWQGGVPGQHFVIAALDGDYLTHERELHVNAGMEYFWERSYGGRIGYQFNREDSGLTLGFGIRWRGRMLFDYGWALGNELNAAHRITLTYRFGGVPPSQRARQRRPYIESVPERERLRGIEDRQPVEDSFRRPRPVPRERSRGVPGWIY